MIEALEHDRKAPVENLDDLYSLLVEKRMWYTQIEEKGTIFRISGVAIDNQTVADYMTRLDKSNRFQNVKLLSTKQYTFKGTDLLLKQFDINFEVQSTTKDDPESKKE